MVDIISKLIIVIASGVGALSTLLPWVSSGNSTASGLDNGAHSLTVLLLFAAAIAVTLAIESKQHLPRWAKAAIAAFGGVATIIMFYIFISTFNSGYSNVSLGVGAIFALLAAICVIVAALVPFDKLAANSQTSSKSDNA